MILIYGMPSCPDCAFVEAQVKGDERFQVIDIGSDVKLLKEFLRMHDGNAAFASARRHGQAGIPCFVMPDGTVTLNPADVGLQTRPVADGEACALDGSGC